MVMASHFGANARKRILKRFKRALDILKGVIAREDKRHMMDEHLTASMRDASRI